jgi:transaldolase/glucose-6-phosphate isomerase
VSRLKSSLPESLTAAVKTTVKDWKAGGKMQRLWQRDASLWTGDDEASWLGWLDITEEQIAHAMELRNLAKEVWSAGYKDVLLLGMGGSSLCPEVLRMTFGQTAGYPDLHVLDSTDPAQVKAFENKIDIAKTLFIVSSKSGSTLEPNIFKQYFFELTKKAVGAD